MTLAIWNKSFKYNLNQSILDEKNNRIIDFSFLLSFDDHHYLNKNIDEAFFHERKNYIIREQIPPILPLRIQFFEQLCLNGAEAKIPCDPSVQIFCPNNVKDGNQF